MSIHYVTKSALIHVQDHQEGVWNDEGVVRFQECWVALPRVILAVVVQFTSAQVPAPGLSVASYQGCVAHRVKGGVARSHAHHGVRSPLTHGPADLPHMQSSRVANTTPDGVRALRHRVPVKHQLVVVLDEDVERAVVVIPRVLDLDVGAGGRHVQQQVQPSRLAVIQGVQLLLQGTERWIPHINGFNATWDFLPHAPSGYDTFLFLLPPPP